MKQKTIEKILQKKISQWIDTIDDSNVKQLAKENTIVTGGSIASMLLNEKVNDIDIYFRNIETVKAIADYYNKKAGSPMELMDSRFRPDNIPTEKEIIGINERLKESRDTSDTVTPDTYASARYVAWNCMQGEDRIKLYKYAGYYSVNGSSTFMEEESNGVTEDKDIFSSIQEAKEETKEGSYTPLFFTSNAITLSDGIQLVIRFFGEAGELHKNYDFVHATSYYDHKTKKVTVPYEALMSLMNKELRYIGSKYPVTSVIRTKKFIKRGWTCGVGTYLKILFQVSELNLKDINVLTEQCMGVNVGLFSLVIDALNNKDTTKSDGVTYEYISALIDKIFG